MHKMNYAFIFKLLWSYAMIEGAKSIGLREINAGVKRYLR